MVKVNFNVQKILVARSQQLSLCALYYQPSSDILWKRLNVRVQKVSSNRTMFPYDKIHKVCFSHLGWLFFSDGRALWSLPRIQVGATFITTYNFIDVSACFRELNLSIGLSLFCPERFLLGGKTRQISQNENLPFKEVQTRRPKITPPLRLPGGSKSKTNDDKT